MNRIHHLPAGIVLGSCILLLSLTACDSNASGGGGSLDMVVAVGDTMRAVRVRVPDQLILGAEASLLIAFHGSNDSGKNFQKGTGIDEAAWDDMLVAYPTAARGNWAEGCNCNIADRLQIDDMGFVEAIIDTLSTMYRLTPSRTFALGFSQGGLFAYRLACQMGDRFGGVAAVSAPMSVPLSRVCSARHPVSVMTFHGTKDAVLPWEGSTNGSFSLLSARDSAILFADKYGCMPSTKTTHHSGSATVVESRWSECSAPAQVRLYEVPTGIHTWYARNPDSREFFMDFFHEASQLAQSR